MSILLIIIVTTLCIMAGMRTRHNKRIVLTQLAGEGDGYIIETEEKNVIIIDGGTENDASRIAQILAEKETPEIVAWFLTSAENDKSGALCEILNNHPDIQVPQIFVSFNSEVYQNSGLPHQELDKINANLECLYSSENAGKLREMERRAEYQFDNYFITPLEVKDLGELSGNDISNQAVILKIDNTFKNMIFLGGIGDEKAHFFKENDQDQFECDAIQISGDKLTVSGKEIFDTIKPETTIISGGNVPSFVNSENVYTKANGEVTVEIW